ncbi:MAG: SDR family NAD(P)-dependent oxidoreductase [Nitriliruptoraceae bacterium]
MQIDTSTPRMHQRTVFVSGGGSDPSGWANGAAAAVLYAAHGASVFVVDRDLARAQVTVDHIVENGGAAVAHAADVTDEDAVENAVAACVDTFGALDTLHNNVGIVTLGAITELPLADWQRALNVNMTGMFLTCKHALPALEAAGRSAIVNIGSVSGIRHTGVSMIAYAASKSAVGQFTRSIALEYATRGVRANAVLPGLMNTPLVTNSMQGTFGTNDSASLLAARDALCPTGKMGTAWDVAQAALFLASHEAEYVTGIELVVDGGLSAKAG